MESTPADSHVRIRRAWRVGGVGRVAPIQPAPALAAGIRRGAGPPAIAAADRVPSVTDTRAADAAGSAAARSARLRSRGAARADAVAVGAFAPATGFVLGTAIGSASPLRRTGVARGAADCVVAARLVLFAALARVAGAAWLTVRAAEIRGRGESDEAERRGALGRGLAFAVAAGFVVTAAAGGRARPAAGSILPAAERAAAPAVLVPAGLARDVAAADVGGFDADGPVLAAGATETADSAGLAEVDVGAAVALLVAGEAFGAAFFPVRAGSVVGAAMVAEAGLTLRAAERAVGPGAGPPHRRAAGVANACLPWRAARGAARADLARRGAAASVGETGAVGAAAFPAAADGGLVRTAEGGVGAPYAPAAGELASREVARPAERAAIVAAAFVIDPRGAAGGAAAGPTLRAGRLAGAARLSGLEAVVTAAAPALRAARLPAAAGFALRQAEMAGAARTGFAAGHRGQTRQAEMVRGAAVAADAGLALHAARPAGAPARGAPLCDRRRPRALLALDRIAGLRHAGAGGRVAAAAGAAGVLAMTCPSANGGDRGAVLARRAAVHAAARRPVANHAAGGERPAALVVAGAGRSPVGQSRRARLRDSAADHGRSERADQRAQDRAARRSGRDRPGDVVEAGTVQGSLPSVVPVKLRDRRSAMFRSPPGASERTRPGCGRRSMDEHSRVRVATTLHPTCFRHPRS